MNNRLITFSAYAVTLGLSCPVSAMADSTYTFLKGKNIAVCRDYFDNLKSFQYKPMVCEREFGGDNTTFVKPKWTEVNLLEHHELAKRLYKFFLGGDQFIHLADLDNATKYQTYIDQIERKSTLLYISNVDVDNDNKKEILARYMEGPCPSAGYEATSVLVLANSMDMIDTSKTESLLQSPNSYDLHGKAINHSYLHYDVFLYKGSTYFDRWNRRDLTLTVYHISNNEAKEICKFKYEYNDLNVDIMLR